MSNTARSRVTVRGLLASGAAVMAGVMLAVIATSGTYAYLSDDAQLESASITAGAAGLVVEGNVNHAIAGMDVSRLVPDATVYTAFDVTNTGDVALAVTVSGTQVTAQTLGLSSHLTASLAPVPSKSQCTESVPGAVRGPLPTFATSGSPVTVPAAAMQVFCLAVSLSATAPPSVQGGTASFTLTLDGTQVST